MSEPLLEVRGLVTVYRPAGRGAPVRAVDDVDLEVHAGEVVGLIGESGCGKTSLIRTALGLLPRAAGTVRALGLDPHHLARGEEPRLRQGAQLLFQDPGASLNPGLTVTEQLLESIRIHRPEAASRASRAALIAEVLAAVDLPHRAHALPAELSGGEKRRVTLAQLQLARPRLVLADEPTAGLDAARKAELLDLLLARSGPETGYLLISHDLPLVLYASTRVLVMQAGRIVDSFVPAALSHAPRHPLTRALCASAGIPTAEAP